MQDKHRTPANERFFKLRRGEVVAVTNTEPKGDGLGLDETSEVKVVAWAGQPVLPPSEDPGGKG